MDTPLTRREFTGRLAAAAPAVLGGYALRAAAQAPPAVGANSKIRVGLIGCGGMGKGDLATFLQVPEVECPVICDVDDAQFVETLKTVEKAGRAKPETVKDFRKILDRKDIDAVVVATPDHWHALPTVLACQAGKDVYVEKPLATTIAEGRAMAEAARKHQRVVQMGSQWRSNPHVIAANDFVRSGKLGKIRYVRVWAYLDWKGDIGNPPDGPPPPGADYDMWLGPARQRPFNPNRFHFNFRWFWDYAGGLMTDWGVHLIGMALYGMGTDAPRTISSSGGKLRFTDNAETPDTQVAVYEFPSYVLVWEHQAGVGVGPNGRAWGIWFSGSEGTLVLDGDGWEVIPEAKKNTLKPEKHAGSSEARLFHVKNFLDSVRSRQASILHPDLGHYVSTVAHLGNISQRCGRKIVWDPRAEKITGDPEADKLVRVEYRKPWSLPGMG